MKSWQHYTLLAVLAIYVSILCLGISGDLASFGYGDAKVEFVNKKVDEANKLAEEMQKLAKSTADLTVMNVKFSGLPRDAEEVEDRFRQIKKKTEELLKNARCSDEEIEKITSPIDEEIQREIEFDKKFKASQKKP